MRAPGEKAASKSPLFRRAQQVDFARGIRIRTPLLLPAQPEPLAASEALSPETALLPSGSSLSEKMERDGLSSADQKLIRESWQKVGTSPLEHGTVLFTR